MGLSNSAFLGLRSLAKNKSSSHQPPRIRSADPAVSRICSSFPVGISVGHHPPCAVVVIDMPLPCFLVHVGDCRLSSQHRWRQSLYPCCPTVPGPERGEATCGRTLPRMVGGRRALPVPCPAAPCGYDLHHPCHAAGAIPVCRCCGLLQQSGECELGVRQMGAASISK